MSDQAQVEHVRNVETRFLDAVGTMPGFAVMSVNGEQRQVSSTDMAAAVELSNVGFAGAVAVRGEIEIRWPDRRLRCVAEHIADIGVTYSIVYSPLASDLGKSVRRLVRKGLRHGWNYRKSVAAGRGPLPSTRLGEQVL